MAPRTIAAADFEVEMEWRQERKDALKKAKDVLEYAQTIGAPDELMDKLHRFVDDEEASLAEGIIVVYGGEDLGSLRFHHFK